MRRAFLLFSCAFTFTVYAQTTDLVDRLHETDSLIKNCETAIPKLTTDFDNFTAFSRDQLLEEGDLLIERLFQGRLHLRNRILSLSPSCVFKTRSLFRAVRAVEDILGEVHYREKQITPQEIDFFQQPVPLKDYNFYHGHLQNKDFDSIDFKAGDIMITRGVSYQSALIAQIARPQGQYSHIVQVHVDKGEMFTIESYISSGVDTYSEKYALQNENARIMLLRFNDEELAKRASTYVYELAKSRRAANDPIPYDFFLDFEDHSKLSCAEIAKMGYEFASDGEIVIPYFSSSVNSNDINFLKSLGLTPRQIFEPIDMEVDPRFDVVLEWRDYRLMRDSRHKDVVLKSILQWIDEKDYKLSSNFKATIATAIIYPLRDTFLWPKLRKLGVPDFSTNIPKSAFKTNVRLTEIADVLIAHLRKVDRGFPMTMKQLETNLEEFRREDLENYNTNGATKFHYFFRPRSL